MQVKDSENTWQ